MRAAGVVLFFSVALLPAARAAPPEAATGSGEAAPPATRLLVLCVDGVSYSLVEEMHRRGELPHFRPPSRLVSTFPSLTDPSLVEILGPAGAPPSEGYEDYYFDTEENRTRGGFFHRFSRRHYVEGTFRELFHYHPHPLVMTLEYGLPVLGSWLAGRWALSRILRKFERSDAPVFLAYLDSTDSLAHLSGERFQRGLLKRIDGSVAYLRQRAKQPIEVVVFSDHGNGLHKYRRAPLVPALKRAGFRLRKSLAGPRDVVLIRYGLVGSALLYARPGAEAELAEAVRSAEGVAVAAYRDATGVVVLNSSGRARLRRQPPDLYCYEPESGDPLELEPVLDKLAGEGGLASGNCAPDHCWWLATQEHRYPDALRRLWFAFEKYVVHPASVIISFADGYYEGSRVLDFLAALRATHGNLGPAQSLAFAMRTDVTLPPFLRGEEMWPWLSSPAGLVPLEIPAETTPRPSPGPIPLSPPFH